MDIKSTIDTIVTQFKRHQAELAPYLSKDANASEVYEQLEIQKILFQSLELSTPLSFEEQEALTEQFEIFTDTMKQTERLVQIMKEMYGEH